jgi:hypothetical protein
MATFLDYNKDGHLDLFVGNHPTGRMQPYVHHNKMWKAPVPEFSNRLYKNNGNETFTEVTEEAGLLTYGWTLGAITADLNQDDWPDLFVSVDHDGPDRYYLNNKDGTFAEVSGGKMKHLSYSSMGIDAGDINNDGLLDLAVVEMLSTNNYDEKTKMSGMNPLKFWTFVNVGYNYQYMRNMLHLNTGDGEFSEIAQMANVHRTNWSWAALIADFDNDGWEDFFVANGYYREFLEKDYFKNLTAELQTALDNNQPRDQIIKDMAIDAPVNKVENNFFRNNGDLTFSDVGKEYGLNKKGFSSGAAYADLDNDGDLDLIVSNIDEPASVYKNNERENGGANYLRIHLKTPADVSVIGTKVTLQSKNGLQFKQHTYTRGFQSAVDGLLHFGLNDLTEVDEVKIEWMNGKTQILSKVAANQKLKINYQDNLAKTVNNSTIASKPIFVKNESSGIDFKHQEDYFDDYKKQILLPHQMSQMGPFLSKGDVNGDGLDDFFVGGANGQTGAIYLQNQAGNFSPKAQLALQKNKAAEDMGSALFDADGDGDLDLYVVSGGNEFDENASELSDRLYLNNGKGVFTKSKQNLPNNSGSCVKPYDFDKDGDLDLFVGGRQIPGKYPSPADSYLLQNEQGKFTNITQKVAPAFASLGMVTDAHWTDLNGDGSTDLLVVGEWMSPTMFLFENNQFSKKEVANKLGWWNKIAVGDFDKDGDEDFILGNLGINYKYKASDEKPFHIYGKDFDESGTFDIALGYFLENETLYPVRGKQCSSEQIPSIGEKFPTYDSYGKASIFDVYGEGLNDALHYEANYFHTSLMRNLGNGNFEIIPLTNLAQIAPTNAIIVHDFNADGNLDLLLGGNLHTSEVETGRADAGRGTYLIGKGDGTFEALFKPQTGLNIDGDVKDVQMIQVQNQSVLLVANNNATLDVWQYKK